ncbi:preQ(1) synthase [Candidatus Margulisiibacteriota bacterium]
MAQAEGKIFNFDPPENIRTDFLEVFPYKGEKQFITYETSEFSAVCPFSGLPDIAKVVIEYVPKKHCLELKALKYYFISFRNIGIYQEAVTDRIFKDIFKILKPRYLKVTTVYNTRGGIDAACFIEKGRK